MNKLKNVLVIILHFNSYRYTNSLYKSLKPFEIEGNYDLEIMDNGSDESGRSEYSSLILPENIYFGGALNAAFEYFLDQGRWRSLLFLNSDLIVHPSRFVKTLYSELLCNQMQIVTPTILDVGSVVCRWRQMHNWHTGKTRTVRWVDFQAPMFSSDFINLVGGFPLELSRGWGQDILSGILLENHGGRIGAVDQCMMAHLRSATINDNQHIESINKYNEKANAQMKSFFSNGKLKKDFDDLRKWAENYVYSP